MQSEVEEPKIMFRNDNRKTPHETIEKSESTPKSSVNRKVVGLKNIGNTCYMNSVLQCLLVTPYLSEFFLGGQFKTHASKISKSYTLSKAFYHLINKVANSGEIIVPTEIKAAISKKSH
mmetsp:Transcript_42586/g.40852  ORF Transcript_42586/g.40852 Transcript_42586/m.40852 type:complete len:119 (+) Transcript_42586:884-1240(+)